jgi:uncharacterized membrane protein
MTYYTNEFKKSCFVSVTSGKVNQVLVFILFNYLNFVIYIYIYVCVCVYTFIVIILLLSIVITSIRYLFVVMSNKIKAKKNKKTIDNG